MSVLQLTVPYADTGVDRLGYALGLPAQEALGDLAVPEAAGPGTRLSLRLLGASHQALLETAAGGFSETVACLDAVEPALPASVRRTLPVGRYVFTAEVRQLTPDTLRREADALRKRLARRPHSLVGVFPGEADALTALLAEPRPAQGVVGWQTWHVYPQTAEVAYTRSVIRVGHPGRVER